MTRRQRSARVLITGASSGIGRELAREFAAHGHDLVLVARTRNKLRELAQELEQRHRVKASVIVCDLSRSNAADELFRATERRKLAIDVLVNNAGAMFNGDFWEIPAKDQEGTLQLNVTVLTLLTYRFLPPMLERGHGRILNVGSLAGFLALPRLAVYAASKAYVLSFTEALSEELKGTGVTATVLCPGMTATSLLNSAPDSARLPPLPTDTPEEVARHGYQACVHGVPVYVTGLANQIASQLLQWQPRWFTRALSGMLARQRRSP